MARIARTCLAVALVSSAVACGSAPKAQAPVAAAPPPAAAPASAAAPSAAIARSELRDAIDRGLGALLRNVAVDDYPVMQKGKFHGFRIRAISPRWNVGIKPGDVVTGINGMPIEHPEQADAALRSLASAKTLRVDYERDGKPLVYEVPIVDDAAPAAPAPKAAARP